MRDMIQEIVDHGLQTVTIFARGIQQFGLLFREWAGDPFGAKVHRHAQGRKRRAKLVRDRRHHVIFQFFEAAHRVTSCKNTVAPTITPRDS